MYRYTIRCEKVGGSTIVKTGEWDDAVWAPKKGTDATANLVRLNALKSFAGEVSDKARQAADTCIEKNEGVTLYPQGGEGVGPEVR